MQVTEAMRLVRNCVDMALLWGGRAEKEWGREGEKECDYHT